MNENPTQIQKQYTLEKQHQVSGLNTNFSCFTLIEEENRMKVGSIEPTTLAIEGLRLSIGPG